MLMHHILTLIMLTLLQAVLGFDNLLYISIESKRVPPDKQSMVRKWGIGLAIALRIVLLIVIVQAIEHFQTPFLTGFSPIEFDMNVHSLIVLLGGGFIIYTAIKEIMHMVAEPDLGEAADDQKRSVGSAIFWIIVMNLVFSFDSILSAIALASTPVPETVATAAEVPGDRTEAEPVVDETNATVAPKEAANPPSRAREITNGAMVVMSLAVILSGLMMILLADRVSEFLKKNRLYEVLGLFILFIVGIMLVSEGGHLAHLKLFGYAVEPMAKTTFYFVLVVLILVDLVQGRFQKKLMAQSAAKAAAAKSA